MWRLIHGDTPNAPDEKKIPLKKTIKLGSI
jgi:hypothetical protein